MVNKDLEELKDQSRERQEEESDQLVSHYCYYVNQKGRSLKHVRLPGIDKTSNNYTPDFEQKGPSFASYCIKTIGNTFVNHVIGTVGFTVAEYFGSTVLYDTFDDNYDDYDTVEFVPGHNNSYNIVQVVHGASFTRDTQVLSRWKYKHNPNDLPLNYITGYYDPRAVSEKRRGVWRHKVISTKDTFFIVHRKVQIEVSQPEYKNLRSIINYNAVPYNGIWLPRPIITVPLSPTYKAEYKEHRLFRLYLGTTKKVNNFKLYKYLYPKPFDTKISNKINPAIIYRPINVQDYNYLKLRYWYYKQVQLWAQFGDLQNNNGTDKSFPEFQTDFYKVKYMITRE
jgi:hypothetical protein